MFVPGSVLSNVSGWDLSACSNGGFLTCTELFVDNQSLIFGGRTTEEVILEGVFGFLSTLSQPQREAG